MVLRNASTTRGYRDRCLTIRRVVVCPTYGGDLVILIIEENVILAGAEGDGSQADGVRKSFRWPSNRL